MKEMSDKDWLQIDKKAYDAAEDALNKDIAERGHKPDFKSKLIREDYLAWWEKRDRLVRERDWWRDMLVYHARLRAMRDKLEEDEDEME